ncbi:hypothetical protein P4O66_006373 [Electrophorus voltai]|uniref:Deoxyribonuclease n=1 Tax=Electrophorus voltai TaxID=2609070 RepID=A0AAD8ZHZ5_9TELE|nr:hypothetical protein P4O66_006373 [Electrophorus voltai]
MSPSLFLLLSFGGVLSLKICSFNIQSFGESKVSKPVVLNIILEHIQASWLLYAMYQAKATEKSITRCDLMLVMEIKDAKGTAFPQLMTHLNNRYRGRRPEYGHVISQRLGRKSYKEQYAFIYRQKLVSLKSVYQYPDIQSEDTDAFAREPFVVWFSSPTTGKTQTASKTNLLPCISQQNFIIMGDFNAACGYVPKKDWPNIRLRSTASFFWITGDDLDTSVKESTKCAYDRSENLVVLHGEKIIQAIRPESVEVYNFKQAFGLTEQQALTVSDHFPLCITVNAVQRSG